MLLTELIHFNVSSLFSSNLACWQVHNSLAIVLASRKNRMLCTVSEKSGRLSLPSAIFLLRVQSTARSITPSTQPQTKKKHKHNSHLLFFTHTHHDDDQIERLGSSSKLFIPLLLHTMSAILIEGPLQKLATGRCHKSLA